MRFSRAGRRIMPGACCRYGGKCSGSRRANGRGHHERPRERDARRGELGGVLRCRRHHGGVGVRQGEGTSWSSAAVTARSLSRRQDAFPERSTRSTSSRSLWRSCNAGLGRRRRDSFSSGIRICRSAARITTGCFLSVPGRKRRERFKVVHELQRRCPRRRDWWHRRFWRRRYKRRRGLRNGAVGLDLTRATCSGVPAATRCPPSAPASGPISRT